MLMGMYGQVAAHFPSTFIAPKFISRQHTSAMPQSDASLHAMGDSIFCVQSSDVTPHSFIEKLRQHITGQVNPPHGMALPGSPPVLDETVDAATEEPTATEEVTPLEAAAPPEPPAPPKPPVLPLPLPVVAPDEESPLPVPRPVESPPQAASPDTTKAAPIQMKARAILGKVTEVLGVVRSSDSTIVSGHERALEMGHDQAP